MNFIRIFVANSQLLRFTDSRVRGSRVTPVARLHLCPCHAAGVTVEEGYVEKKMRDQSWHQVPAEHAQVQSLNHAPRTGVLINGVLIKQLQQALTTAF